MHSAKNIDELDRKEKERVRNAKGTWTKYNGKNPYQEKYGDGDVDIHENLPDWEKAWLETQKDWYQEMRKSTKMRKHASIKDFILFLIKCGNDVYNQTKRKDTWMIWHDALSILWDKESQKWLRTLKCPIEGWEDRTWADRFIRLRGKYNEMVSKSYKNGLPGDSPELMPLDCHLFSDIKEGVARNVAFSFFLDDNDPDKYSLSTPINTFKAIQKTIASGCPLSERILEDTSRIQKSTLDRIIEAKGSYIEDSARHGVRDAARRASLEDARQKEMKFHVDPNLWNRFESMADKMIEGGGIPFTTWQLTEIEDVPVVEAEDGICTRETAENENNGDAAAEKTLTNSESINNKENNKQQAENENNGDAAAEKTSTNSESTKDKENNKENGEIEEQ